MTFSFYVWSRGKYDDKVIEKAIIHCKENYLLFVLISRSPYASNPEHMSEKLYIETLTYDYGKSYVRKHE